MVLFEVQRRDELPTVFPDRPKSHIMDNIAPFLYSQTLYDM
jgi:hypothetical protein